MRFQLSGTHFSRPPPTLDAIILLVVVIETCVLSDMPAIFRDTLYTSFLADSGWVQVVSIPRYINIEIFFAQSDGSVLYRFILVTIKLCICPVPGCLEAEPAALSEFEIAFAFVPRVFHLFT